MIPLRTADGTPLGAVLDDGGDLASLERDRVSELLRAEGVVLARGFRVGADGFRRFTERLGRDFIGSPAPSRRAVSADDTVQTVDGGRAPIALHSELSYLPLRPELCWFHCVRPPARGGQTLLCDGKRVAAALPRPILDELARHALRFPMELGPRRWRRLFGCDSVAEAARQIARRGGASVRIDGELIHVEQSRPVLDTPRFGAGPVFCNNLMNYRQRFAACQFADGTPVSGAIWEALAAVTERLTVELAWRADDVLVVDNTRVMHGRRAIADEERLIHTRFGDASF